MAALTVRNLDPAVKTWLRVNAAQQGIAMEEAVRRILTRAAIAAPESSSGAASDLGTRIQARFVGLGGLELPERHAMRVSPLLDLSQDEI